MLQIEKVQKRIANISVGPSTLRGQPKGTMSIVINFLSNLDLNVFKNANEERVFKGKLDSQTEYLKNLMSSGSWGFARKVLNIFLFQVVHDIYLSEEYSLKKLIPFLEVALDNPNAKKLLKRAKERSCKFCWRNIKSLEKEESDEIQKFAKIIAKDEFGVDRCYLDLYFWRE
jgi:hypothetical protein